MKDNQKIKQKLKEIAYKLTKNNRKYRNDVQKLCDAIYIAIIDEMSEVRITLSTYDESLFVEKLARRCASAHNLYDEKKSKPGRVEFTNGSCIVALIETGQAPS